MTVSKRGDCLYSGSTTGGRACDPGLCKRARDAAYLRHPVRGRRGDGRYSTERYGADIDIDEFFRLFWDRRSGSKSKIPKAMEAPFLLPQNDAEARIKETIVEFSADQTAKLEEDLFKQRKRLADAERTLLTKTTKAATESQRIATDKIAWIRS